MLAEGEPRERGACEMRVKSLDREMTSDVARSLFVITCSVAGCSPPPFDACH